MKQTTEQIEAFHSDLRAYRMGNMEAEHLFKDNEQTILAALEAYKPSEPLPEDRQGVAETISKLRVSIEQLLGITDIADQCGVLSKHHHDDIIPSAERIFRESAAIQAKLDKALTAPAVDVEALHENDVKTLIDLLETYAECTIEELLNNSLDFCKRVRGHQRRKGL